ncbi:MAG: CoA-binding protein [Candidatus Thorarchaeota archaeon]
MDKNKIDLEEFKKFDTLFNPKHIAFIGASESSTFGAMLYLRAFKRSKWSETFYPINPKREEIMGWKCYPSVLKVPYPIDTAYVSLKTQFIPQVIKECVEKKIHWVIVFASGFSETGDPEGKKMEQELKEIIKDSETRIIGPNCLGPYSPGNGMMFSSSFARTGILGSVSFMSQSGGHLTQLLDVGFKRDIRFRYGVSFGNQIDLSCLDFLRHFHNDPKTKVIAAYLESFGSAYGYDFFLELKKTTRIKPVIIWKGGYTHDGTRAAFSHTGAMASDLRLWKTMAKQTGMILVKDNEEWWNTTKTFELLFPKYLPKGRNVAIITPGGGNSVNVTDLFAAHNLKVPDLTPNSQEKVSKILPNVNVNIKNPIDLGASGFVIDLFIECIEICVNDPNIDIVIVPFWPHHLFNWVFKRMLKIQQRTEKPIIFCIPSVADSIDIAKKFNRVRKILNKKRALYFLSFRDAANSISLLCDYADYLRSRNIEIMR